MTVGSTAYREAAVMMRMRSPRGRESEDGGAARRAVGAGHEVRSLRRGARRRGRGDASCGGRDERSVVKLYERWLKTGSSRLADELGSHGIMPSRGAGGLN